jgi:hypothetical protein
MICHDTYGPWSGHIDWGCTSKGRIVQGTHRPRATLSKGDVIQGPRLFVLGHFGQGHFITSQKDRRNEYSERCLQFHLILVKKVTKMSHYKA